MSSELYQELRTNTFSNIDNRRAKQEDERRRHDEHLSDVLNRLEGTIMYNCYEKMRQASMEGHFYATLYSFTNQDMFDDFKTVFLMKGPYRSQFSHGLIYFEQKNIVPILTRLKNVLDPIDVYIKYDRMTKTHHVMASWKTAAEN
jgi:hypothetical protein